MDLQLEKQWIKTVIDETDDVEVIQMIRQLLTFSRKYSLISPMTMDEFNEKINNAEKAIEDGDVINNEDLKEEFKRLS